jgi:hypothetical protein
MKKRLLLLASTLSVILLGVSSTVSAINYGGVGGRPAYPNPANPRTQSIFIYQLAPGQQANDGLKILNNTNQAQTVTLDAVDSEVASGGSFTCKQSAEPKTNVGEWIHLQTNTVTVDANNSLIVPFTIAIPQSSNLDVGEYDGCITIQAASQTATQSSHAGILLSFRSAIRVAVTIPGKIIKKLSIQSVKVSSAKGGNYQVTPTVSNDGNVSLDTTLKVNLVSLFGTRVESTKEGTSPVLPRTKASWNYDVKQPFWGGFYHAQVTATYNGNPSTELGANQNSNQQIKALNSAIFFATPTLIGGLVELVIVLAVVIVLVWMIRKRQHLRQVRHHWQDYSVQHGDSIERLAKEFGIPWKKLAATNKLKPPFTLKKGQRLKLPPSSKD